MSSRAAKFISRATRYTLNPNDNRFLRYAHHNDNGRTFTTRFVDISQTGLAFITDNENAPRLSDLIKIEIPLDANNTIAWWARVVRVEEYAPHKWYLKADDFQSENQVLVAIVFHELPPAHSRLIRETLDKKFAEMHEINRRERMQNITKYMAEQIWLILLYASLIFATGWLLYFLSRPGPNYDADRGAPWGQRYPRLNIFTPQHNPLEKSSPDKKSPSNSPSDEDSPEM